MRSYRFEPLERLQAAGLEVEQANYRKVYIVLLVAADTIEDIYRLFNVNPPSDFSGHSLSVRECLAGVPRRSWKGPGVMEVLADIMLQRSSPEYIRSDNGPEFIAKRLRKWLFSLGIITTYIEPGSPWENGYCESFNSRMRDEFLNGELFGNLYEVQVLAKRWKDYYNSIRPHGSLGGRPPAPQSVLLTA